MLHHGPIRPRRNHTPGCELALRVYDTPSYPSAASMANELEQGYLNAITPIFGQVLCLIGSRWICSLGYCLEQQPAVFSVVLLSRRWCDPRRVVMHGHAQPITDSLTRKQAAAWRAENSPGGPGLGVGSVGWTGWLRAATQAPEFGHAGLDLVFPEGGIDGFLE